MAAKGKGKKNRGGKHLKMRPSHIDTKAKKCLETESPPNIDAFTDWVTRKVLHFDKPVSPSKEITEESFTSVEEIFLGAMKQAMRGVDRSFILWAMKLDDLKEGQDPFKEVMKVRETDRFVANAVSVFCFRFCMKAMELLYQFKTEFTEMPSGLYLQMTLKAIETDYTLGVESDERYLQRQRFKAMNSFYEEKMKVVNRWKNSCHDKSAWEDMQRAMAFVLKQKTRALDTIHMMAGKSMLVSVFDMVCQVGLNKLMCSRGKSGVSVMTDTLAISLGGLYLKYKVECLICGLRRNVKNAIKAGKDFRHTDEYKDTLFKVNVIEEKRADQFSALFHLLNDVYDVPVRPLCHYSAMVNEARDAILRLKAGELGVKKRELMKNWDQAVFQMRSKMKALHPVDGRVIDAIFQDKK